MSHNKFQSSEPIEPQEASPMKHEMHVLGIDIAKRVFQGYVQDGCKKMPQAINGTNTIGCKTARQDDYD